MPDDICIHPWAYQVEPFCIADDLYYVGNADVSSHLIDTGAGLILLDTAFPQTVYLLCESIRRLGFDPRDIALILHCHAHYDHCGGTRALVGLTGARTALGKDDAFILTERPELTWAPEYGVDFHETFQVDRLLSDGDRVVLGRAEIECVHIPGHTPGSMSFFFDVRDGGTRYRVGLHGGPGLNTLSDAYLTQYGLSRETRTQYLASLQKLKTHPVDIVLGAHPGQNDTLGKRQRMAPDENPFIDTAEWLRYLGHLETGFHAIAGPG